MICHMRNTAEARAPSPRAVNRRTVLRATIADEALAAADRHSPRGTRKYPPAFVTQNTRCSKIYFTIAFLRI